MGTPIDIVDVQIEKRANVAKTPAVVATERLCRLRVRTAGNFEVNAVMLRFVRMATFMF